MKRKSKGWPLPIAFIISFIFFIFGAILATFLYMKNIDLGNIRKRQEYLIKEVEELRKERAAIMANFRERGLIKEWNEEAIKPKEGKWILPPKK